MKQRKIGPFTVAEIGFGCMNLSHGYGPGLPPEDGKAVIERALDLGVTHFDTAAIYGNGRNEELVGPTLKPHRDRIMLASKGGMNVVDGKRVIDGRPETLLKTIDASLVRLQTDVIELYYLHRWDKTVPIEESVGALAQMVEAGKVRTIGLSEVSAVTLRKAHAVHPITAVQSEYSLWSRNAEVAVLDASAELGVAYVAFSPVARGFLAGGVASANQFAEGDIRKGMPRFQEPHLAANLALLKEYEALAEELGCTKAQLALAWLLHKAPHIVPIPGTTSIAHLEEDIGAADVSLSADAIARVEALVNDATVGGPRYPAPTQVEIDTEEIPSP